MEFLEILTKMINDQLKELETKKNSIDKNNDGFYNSGLIEGYDLAEIYLKQLKNKIADMILEQI